ncbi:DUF167 domain-containing protein [Dehalogenimonas sp. THU2]|uniref:DUF167 domain-containing protein n=1 Tax=Dehalogenimonas sp. THU2 TaxID=3151121 RepID=UPI003218D7E6
MNQAIIIVRIQPGAGKTGVVGRHDEGVKIRVAAPPEKGKANATLIEFVAERLSISRDAVEILRGHTSRNKVLRITGMDQAEALRRMLGED